MLLGLNMRSDSSPIRTISLFGVASLLLIASCDSGSAPVSGSFRGNGSVTEQRSPSPEGIEHQPAASQSPVDKVEAGEDFYTPRGTVAGYLPFFFGGPGKTLFMGAADAYRLVPVSYAVGGLESSVAAPVSVLPLPGNRLLVVDQNRQLEFAAGENGIETTIAERDAAMRNQIDGERGVLSYSAGTVYLRTGSLEYLRTGGVAEGDQPSFSETSFDRLVRPESSPFVVEYLRIPVTSDMEAMVLVETRVPEGRYWLTAYSEFVNTPDATVVNGAAGYELWRHELDGPRSIAVSMSGAREVVLSGGRQTVVIGLDGKPVRTLENPYGWTIESSAIRGATLLSWSRSGVMGRDFESGLLLWALHFPKHDISTVSFAKDAFAVLAGDGVSVFGNESGLRLGYFPAPGSLDAESSFVVAGESGVWLIPPYGRVEFLHFEHRDGPVENNAVETDATLFPILPGHEAAEFFLRNQREPTRLFRASNRNQTFLAAPGIWLVDTRTLPLRVSLQAAEGSKWRFSLPVKNAAGLKLTVVDGSGIELDSSLDYMALHDSYDLTFSGETRIFIVLDMHGTYSDIESFLPVRIEALSAETNL